MESYMQMIWFSMAKGKKTFGQCWDALLICVGKKTESQ